ncbi:hypothetical protein [Bacillus thuringiensis]|uniref:hypothetical protein n=1 Tax=Bacillus thuringiensis TaxID=1428 RepID=UPI000BEBF6CB|nr:hypothetical protein [Bacillus thuringiensis]PEB10417.1 hypothetical protein COM67_23310 [Bacillus thuringiensis]
MVVFNQQMVKKSIKNYDRAINSLLTAGYNLYQARVKELINLVKTDQILKEVIGPYLYMKVNFEKVENESGGWFYIEMPEEEDLQIAYVFQVMERAAKGEFSMDNYAFYIFKDTQINNNLYDWNHQILLPCLQILEEKLESLIEEEVENKDGIEAQALNIINNYGNGNFAVGSGNTQNLTITTQGVSDEIIKKALEQGTITQDQVKDVQSITGEIVEELGQDSPDGEKLQSFAAKFFDIGKAGLLKIANNSIGDQRWGEAVTTFLLDMVQ